MSTTPVCPAAELESDFSFGFSITLSPWILCETSGAARQLKQREPITISVAAAFLSPLRVRALAFALRSRGARGENPRENPLVFCEGFSFFLVSVLEQPALREAEAGSPGHDEMV